MFIKNKITKVKRKRRNEIYLNKKPFKKYTQN